MKMWRYLLMVVVMIAVASGEKLGNIEVITRDELGSRGLVPPQRETPGQADTLTHTKTSFFNLADTDQPEGKFIPPPALSYLPPVKTPLPIESTQAPRVTASLILQDEYLPPPRGVADEIQPVVETPNTLYIAPQPHAGDQVQPVFETTFNTQTHSDGHVYPVGVEGGVVDSSIPIKPIPDPWYENPYLHYGSEVDKPDFFSGIRDSKLALLGGIVGAKSAVFAGLRNVKESIASGVTGAIAAKAAAFSSLKARRPTYGSVGYDDNYGAINDGGYGSNPGVGVTGVGVVNDYPVEPVPIPAPVPVTPYPPYPIYPPYAVPVYPLPRPVYRPKLALAKLKAPFQPRYSYGGYRRW